MPDPEEFAGHPRGVTLGDMSVSILSVGAEVFQFIQGIESRYRIGGNGSMSPVFAAAFGELSIPQAASDGSVRPMPRRPSAGCARYGVLVDPWHFENHV